jgi:DNA-directed RNA polymerase subunit M/transcription elongation factor TFIIS
MINKKQKQPTQRSPQRITTSMEQIQTGTSSNKENDHACAFKEYHFLELQDEYGDVPVVVKS